MMNLLLSSGGFKVFIIVACLIVGTVILANIYSSIVNHSSKKDKDGCGWPIFLIIIATVVGFLVNIKNCNGNSEYKSNPDWQYKHTDKVK